MDTVTAAIFAAAGRPSYPVDHTGACCLCGVDGAGLAWSAWVKDTFTDHDRLYPGAIVCDACQFCVDDRNETLTQLAGREKPQRMRNYSHVVTTAGHWRAYMKNEKRALTAALLHATDSPIVAVISLAGQKHLATRARLGWWQIEEQARYPQPRALAALLVPITDLYSLGATKAAIETGEYSSAWLCTIDRRRWWHAEELIRRSRGSWLFQLAVWLAQKSEDIDDDRDARSGDGPALADLAGARSGLQEQIPRDDLAAVRGSDSQRRVYNDAESLSQPHLFAAEREPTR